MVLKCLSYRWLFCLSWAKAISDSAHRSPIPPKRPGALLLRIHWKKVGEVFPHKWNGNKAFSFRAVAALLYRYRERTKGPLRATVLTLTIIGGEFLFIKLPQSIREHRRFDNRNESLFLKGRKKRERDSSSYKKFSV